MLFFGTYFALFCYFSLKQEKNHLVSEVEQLKDRLVLMNTEFESANNDRVTLCEKMDELKRKVSQAQQERDVAQRNFTKEVSSPGHYITAASSCICHTQICQASPRMRHTERKPHAFLLKIIS